MPEFLLQCARETLNAGKTRNFTFPAGGGTIAFCCEVFRNQGTIFIIGAGHIAVPLNKIAKILGYRVVVADDREDYANRDRFPDADEISVGPFGDIVDKYAFDENTYVILITRGHVHDKECLKIILGKNVAYIGMIGSLRRLKGVFRLMAQEGFPETALEKVHAPIGLPIGGDTPEQIALSILAEVVSIPHRGPEWSLRLKKEFAEIKKKKHE